MYSLNETKSISNWKNNYFFKLLLVKNIKYKADDLKLMLLFTTNLQKESFEYF